MTTIHQLKEAKGSDKKVIAKCGKEVKWDRKDPLPKSMSAWHTEVTCDECKNAN